MNLYETIDKAGYESIRDNAPGLLKAIEDAIDYGISAKQVETHLLKIYNGSSNVANMAVHAAYHIEKRNAAAALGRSKSPAKTAANRLKANLPPGPGKKPRGRPRKQSK